MTITTTAAYKQAAGSIREYADENLERFSLFDTLTKMGSEMTNKEVKLEIEALGRGVRGITIEEPTEDDSGDEWAQEIEAQLLGDLSDDEMQDVVISEQARKMWSGKSNKEVKLEIEGLSRGVRGAVVEPRTGEDSEEKCARQIEGEHLEEPFDDEMQDTGSRSQTEKASIDEAWAAFDAAVAEDPSAVPQPEPRPTEDMWRMPQSRVRKRDIADDLAGLTTDQAKHLVNLNVSFDVSNLPRYLQSQNMHYQIAARDAATIKDLLNTLWVENHEWLLYEGYGLERIRRVHRLEANLPTREDRSIKDAHSWSIKRDFDAQEQQNAWKGFLEAARQRGQVEALDQQRRIDLQEKTKRLRCVSDHLGNLYDSNGDYWRPKKWRVHAQVEAQIVLYFD